MDKDLTFLLIFNSLDIKLDGFLFFLCSCFC